MAKKDMKAYITIHDAHLNSTGVGTHTQFLIRALMKEDVSLKVHEFRLRKINELRNTIDTDPAYHNLFGVIQSNSPVLSKEDGKHVHIRIGTLGETADGSTGDIAYIVYENFQSLTNIVALAKVLSNYTHVFVPADAFKREIIRLFPQKKDNVHVVHEGTDTQFFTGAYIPPKNTFAVIGKFERRKGHHEIFDVARGWDKEHIHLNLYCDNPWDKDGIEEHISVPFKNVTIKRHSRFKYRNELLDHILLNNRYALMPSFSEGWGLPILDCMAMGMPTITSDSTAMKEYLPAYEKALSTVCPNYKEIIQKTILKACGTISAIDGKFFKDGVFPAYLTEDLKNAMEFMISSDTYDRVVNADPRLWDQAFNDFTWKESTRRFLKTIKGLYGTRFTS